jgi:hypothetical protein
MAAIITENFRRANTRRLIDDIISIDNSYYIGIGRSYPWPEHGLQDETDPTYSVDLPIGTAGDMLDVKNNLVTLIGITTDTCSMVIPKIIPKANHRHKAYNPYDYSCFYLTVEEGVEKYPCYTVVDDKVYLCLREASSGATSFSFPASGSISRTPQVYTDGDNSVWVYLYTLPTDAQIVTKQFITAPIDATINAGVDDPAPTEFVPTANLVYGFTVIDGGSDYTSAPAAQFIPESGSAIDLTTTISGGKVVGVRFQNAILNSVVSWPKQRGYVLIAGNARVLPNIGPVLGFGFNPAYDLPSWYIGIKAEADDLINGDGAYIPYRQISVIKNAEAEDGILDPEISLNALRSLQLTVPSAPTHLTTGDLITQTDTGAIALIDYYDAETRRVYYHQNFETGFRPFVLALAPAESIVNVNSTPYTLEALVPSEYVQGTGDVIFTENRTKITRASGQTEELVIVIQF